MAIRDPDSPPGAKRTKAWLLTLLGEAVIPMTSHVWQGTLVDGLVDLGASTPAARQAVRRAVTDGMLSSERVGRRSRLTISETTAMQLREGRARTLSFGRARAWDGRWLLVALTVPEDSREMRYHFRTQLAWLGFGSLGNGLWISPHTENEKATVELFASLDGPKGAYVFIDAKPSNRGVQEVAAEAWDLDALLSRYQTFIERFDRLEPRDSRGTFVAWVELVTAWRHFPLFDPELPDNLLPHDWPRARAYRLFHHRLTQWSQDALDYFHSPDTGTSSP